MKTERVVILMTPEQKRAIAHRAKALDVSVAELVRRSAEGFGSGADEATLAALAAELHGAVKESRAALRAAIGEAEATLAQLGRRRKDRQAA
ncbi:MAG: hypothetical protein A3D95_04135 [Betaproteobacteria bacterium RIFCSPHIGHO2_12_FULL_69_13]|nr:MAG: hypothetical protein A3D95_04135 [Betaproteobacteria bacterium RIFCSPHIGHO2_12_FULL_69_13]OGA67093.1 MAG: hypothetical protein A3G83_14495 [Betaproteobacteria bacterium RIFCSPLOWO2_12_FULL_68_20]